MAEELYKLSTELAGHEGDVRAVAAFADGTIVSTSRDKTARVWKPSGRGKDYVQSAILKGHSNFVSSVCVINPSEKYVKGFIITGSNDNTICVYVADHTEPMTKIEAHQDTVCKLKTGKTYGMFLSSSWDMTAKLWDINDLSKPQLTMKGHVAAVWCVVDLPCGFIVTGSADKMIIVWTKDGSVQHKLSGHKDCVRDIIAINNDEFVSCGNDAIMYHWNASMGVCIKSYCGHENYIYSITAVPNGEYLYTSGEDRTIRIWHNNEIHQTINLPTLSVWCIDLLQNGDIVAGSSDSMVRIFSADPARYADPDNLQKFEKEVADSKLYAQQELGGIKIKDLPGPQALQQVGQRDGQTKLINEGGSVKAYSWSQSDQKWIQIGDVMGASGGTTATSGKPLYNGKEYDYVFSIDIADGMPALKLPYNIGQDPWHVAQKFIHDNGLSQLFLDQIANFIVKNSKSVPILEHGGQYADPFTGGSRYIPDSTVSNNTPMQQPSVQATHSSSSAPFSTYIPHSTYLKLEQANLCAILEKLREFNAKQENIHKLSEEKLDSVVKLAGDQASEQLKYDTINTLKTLLNWPNETVFPALDIARLSVLDKEVNDKLCTDELLCIIRKHIKPDASAPNQMLAFRLLANMCIHEKGEKLCFDHRDELLKTLMDLSCLGNKNNQVAISTFILNLIIALNKNHDTSGKAKVLEVVLSVLPRLSETEAMFRVLVGLGTLLVTTADPERRNELINIVRQSESTLNILRNVSESLMPVKIPNKLENCSKQIIDLII
ncbi:hypothetical protein KM043_012825 [Ampulex compressa]|nr:hypothetical protein KM043_012825 [Ampulex compressa]